MKNSSTKYLKMYKLIVIHSNGNWVSSDFCLLKSMMLHKKIADVHCRIAYYNHRGEKVAQFFQQPGIIATSIDEVSTTTRPLVRNIRKLPNEIKKLMDFLPHQQARLPFSISLILFLDKTCHSHVTVILYRYVSIS